jgi:hypothetical protein
LLELSILVLGYDALSDGTYSNFFRITLLAVVLIGAVLNVMLSCIKKMKSNMYLSVCVCVCVCVCNSVSSLIDFLLNIYKYSSKFMIMVGT